MALLMAFMAHIILQSRRIFHCKWKNGVVFYGVNGETADIEGDDEPDDLAAHFEGGIYGDDEKGNWIAEVSKSQKAVDCDWTELVGETPPMPANAKSFNVCLYVCRGCTGHVWFDDVSVVQGEKARPAPIVCFRWSAAFAASAALREDSSNRV